MLKLSQLEGGFFAELAGRAWITAERQNAGPFELLDEYSMFYRYRSASSVVEYVYDFMAQNLIFHGYRSICNAL